MTDDQVARLMRVTDNARRRVAERVRRHAAECKTLDRMMADAMDWIRHG